MEKKILVTRSSMPDLKEYIEMIQPLWESRWLTNMGSYHNQLERKLKDYLEVPQLSLMVNGHMALELTIQAMGFPEGAEIITTPFTFVSTTHAIVRNRLKPVFCDIKMSDYTIDEEKILEELELYIGKKIDLEKTLLFFDEVQVSENFIVSLKYFNESEKPYKIVCAGSLLRNKNK